VSPDAPFPYQKDFQSDGGIWCDAREANIVDIANHPSMALGCPLTFLAGAQRSKKKGSRLQN
jgi:hypothetical protein